MTRGRNLSRLYLPVAAIATAVRLWVYASWLDSPLRWFHRVPGLDMQTLLEFGQRLVDGIGLFTLHRTLIAGVWLANGGAHHVVQRQRAVAGHMPDVDAVHDVVEHIYKLGDDRGDGQLPQKLADRFRA